MRPIIDTNNLWYSEETLVYNSRFNIVIRAVFLILIFVFSINLLIHKMYWVALIPLLGSYFLIKSIMKSIADMNSIQLRINDEGIQIKEEPLIAWDKVEHERIITIKSGKSSLHDFVFYDANSHKEIRFTVENFNIDHQEILKSAEIHRNRYNRKSNPS